MNGPPPLPGPVVDVINFMSFGVGIIVVGMIIVGGIQYTTSGGVPQKIEAARKRITNAVIALVLYIFMFAILQWLIPGGLFDTAPPAGEPNCDPSIEECLN